LIHIPPSIFKTSQYDGTSSQNSTAMKNSKSESSGLTYQEIGLKSELNEANFKLQASYQDVKSLKEAMGVSLPKASTRGVSGMPAENFQICHTFLCAISVG
jgi:hypothetical protein